MVQGNALEACKYNAKILQNTLFPMVKFLGGDPTGTGKGGMSIYGECFDDEIHDDLKHTGSFVINN